MPKSIMLFQFQIKDAIKAARIEATKAYKQYAEEPKTSQRRGGFDLELVLPAISLSVIILLIFLALPAISLAEEIEDITETGQSVQPVDSGKPATTTEQLPVVQSSAVTPSVNPEPAVTVEKRAAENMAVGQVSSAETNPTTTVQKTASAQSSTLWQRFLAVFGLHDVRHSIPPLEVKNSPTVAGQDYIIGPGDVLGISVWRDDSLTRSVVVLPDGKIQFPLIGELLAGGKSVAQLKQEFVEKLSRYVVDADISVEVKQSNSLFVYIIGKVNGPGRQILVADTTVLQALAMAGGLNPFAEKEDIKVFRQEKERTLVYSFRYSQVVSGNYLDDNLLLRRGDVIVVP